MNIVSSLATKTLMLSPIVTSMNPIQQYFRFVVMYENN